MGEDTKQNLGFRNLQLLDRIGSHRLWIKWKTSSRRRNFLSHCSRSFVCILWCKLKKPNEKKKEKTKKIHPSPFTPKYQLTSLSQWIGGSHHVTYTVASRMSWGMRGTYFAVFIRLMPGLVWDGIEAWWGGQAVSTMIGTMSLRWANWTHPLAQGTMELKDFVGFVIYYVVCKFFLLTGGRERERRRSPPPPFPPFFPLRKTDFCIFSVL